MMSDVAFWHEHLGQYISDLPEAKSAGAVLPHRLNKGVGPLRIGAIDMFYIVTPEKSLAIGRLEMPESAHVKFVPTETVSARKFVAQWLVNSEAQGPFMVGVLGKADAVASMKISHTPALSYFCQAGEGFSFNMEVVRRAITLIGDLPWKKTVAPAIHKYATFLSATPGNEQDKLMKELNGLLDKVPALRNILPRLKVLPKSGEYEILSWLNIDR